MRRDIAFRVQPRRIGRHRRFSRSDRGKGIPLHFDQLGRVFRKRARGEIAAAHKFALESFASELLAVKDSLEAALAAENASVESMRSGAELTLKQLAGVFERFNLTEISPAGQKFDPHRHQAVSAVEADAEPNTVVQVLQKGYLLHDRVIRPALVLVAKPRGGSA